MEAEAPCRRLLAASDAATSQVSAGVAKHEDFCCSEGEAADAASEAKPTEVKEEDKTSETDPNDLLDELHCKGEPPEGEEAAKLEADDSDAETKHSAAEDFLVAASGPQPTAAGAAGSVPSLGSRGSDRSAASPVHARSRKRGEGRPAVATRILPARDSRLAATLQNQFVVECERFGWRDSGHNSSACENTSAGSAAARGTSREAAGARLRRKSSMSPTKEKEDISGSAVSKRRRLKNPHGAPRGAGKHQASPTRDGHTKHKRRSRAAKPPLLQAREPPPTSCGRPRRHAADRAAAAIVAEASCSVRDFLLLDIPPKELMVAAEQRQRRRRLSRTSRSSESDDSPEEESVSDKKQTKYITNNKNQSDSAEEEVPIAAAPKLQPDEVTSTQPSSKENERGAEGTTADRKDKKTVAVNTPEVEIVCVSHTLLDDDEVVQLENTDGGSRAETEVAVELGSP